MPRQKKKPSYSLHKPTGQAYARLNGKVVYLGKYGTPESKDQYDDVVAAWLEGQTSEHFTLTVDELAIQYLKHCETYYRKDGQQTTEVGKARDALKLVVKLVGRNRARNFGPKKLIAVRDEMISLGWRRITVNQQVGRIRRCFKWGVQQELIPPEVLIGLQTVPGLRAGRSDAKESKPTRPVSLDAVHAVKPYVTRHVWGMIQLQLLTGMRPGEVTQMRGCDLTMTGEVWEYRPQSHKTEHHERERLIMLGREAQTVIRGFLRTDLSEYLFSPADARREFDEEQRENRKTPLYPSHMKRKRKYKPKRKPGERYSKCGYSAAVRKACEKAFDMPAELRNVSTKLPEDEREQLMAKASAWRDEHCWHPHQLRHTAATEIRRTFGIEAAQVVLGHANISTTEIYAEKDRELAAHVMQQLG